MSKEKHRLNIALSMDNPLQRETWTILTQMDNRTNAVCEAVCAHYKQKDFLETLRMVLRDELKNVFVSPSEATKTTEPETNVNEAVMDFLLTLQNE